MLLIKIEILAIAVLVVVCIILFVITSKNNDSVAEFSNKITNPEATNYYVSRYYNSSNYSPYLLPSTDLVQDVYLSDNQYPYMFIKKGKSMREENGYNDQFPVMYSREPIQPTNVLSGLTI